MIELIIGLSITAITAAIIAVLINATAAGTNTQQDGRRLLVRFQSIRAAVADDLANARCVLDVGTNYVVYWTGDVSNPLLTANGAVNVSELRMLEVDSSGNLNLYKIQWPSNFANSDIISANQTYAVNTNWRTAATTAATNGYLVATRLASNAVSLTATLDSASATTAKLVTITIQLNDGVATRTILISTAIRYQGAPT